MICTVRTSNTTRTFVATPDVWSHLVTELDRVAESLSRNDRSAILTLASDIRSQVRDGATQVTLPIDSAFRMIETIDRHRISV